MTRFKTFETIMEVGKQINPREIGQFSMKGFYHASERPRSLGTRVHLDLTIIQAEDERERREAVVIRWIERDSVMSVYMFVFFSRISRD